MFEKAVRLYLDGQWPEAIERLNDCQEVMYDDYPAELLLDFMNKKGGIAPDDWKGYRRRAGGVGKKNADWLRLSWNVTVVLRAVSPAAAPCPAPAPTTLLGLASAPAVVPGPAPAHAVTPVVMHVYGGSAVAAADGGMGGWVVVGLLL
eukprot:608166-Pyramimonas_sp.AAC.1